MFLRIFCLLTAVIFPVASCISCSEKIKSPVLQLNGTDISAAFTPSFSQDDYYYDFKDAETINLSETDAPTITASGAYRLSGTLENASLTVRVDKSSDNGTVFVILDNALISSSLSPINITEAQKVVILLEEGSNNTLIQSSPDTASTAVIYSKADLTVTGSGTLNIITDSNDGINSRDDLKITDGIINITAPGDGIVGKDSVTIQSCTMTLDVGKDGIRSTNSEDTQKGYIAVYGGSFDITAEDDCIRAQTDIYFYDGDFRLISGGGFDGVTKTVSKGMSKGRIPGNGKADFPGNTQFPDNLPQPPEFDAEAQLDTQSESTVTPKAITADRNIYAYGGSFFISAFKDAVSSDGNLFAENAVFDIQSGDDALRSNLSVTINGASITVRDCYEGIEAPYITVNGGKINITSQDDGINVNENGGNFAMNSGEIYISPGGDGIDSNGGVILSAGSIVIDTSKIRAADSPIDFTSEYKNSGCTVTDSEGNTVTASNMPIRNEEGVNRMPKNRQPQQGIQKGPRE